MAKTEIPVNPFITTRLHTMTILLNSNIQARIQKKYISLMFDGYITKVSLDTPIELECENLASF